MATCPSMIVPEILRKDNYETWSILMRHYLIAQDLWNVVQLNELPGEREWITKNALALHSIKISCGAEMLNRIKEMDSAKDVWHALAHMQRPAIYHDIVELQEVVSHDVDELQEETPTGQRQTLHKFVAKGNIGKVKQFLRDNPGSRFESILDSAIHVAITAGKKDIASYLYKETPLQCLHGDRGFFLLQECINKKMFDIAFDLLHYVPELTFTYTSGSTPLILMLAQSPSLLGGRLLGSLALWIYNYIRVKLYLIKPTRTRVYGVGIVEDQQSQWKSIISAIETRNLSRVLDTGSSLLIGFLLVEVYLLQQFDHKAKAGPLRGMVAFFLLVAIFRRHQWSTLIGMLVLPVVAGHKLNLVGQLIAGSLLLLGTIGSVYGQDQGILIVETLIFLVGMVRPSILDPVPIILGQPLLYLVALRRQDLLGTIIIGMPLLLLVTFWKMGLIGVLAQLLLSGFGVTVLTRNSRYSPAIVACNGTINTVPTDDTMGFSTLNTMPTDEAMGLKSAFGFCLSMLLLLYIWLIYDQKLKDEYALKVIHLICQQLSNLNQNQFVQSRAVEATFQAIKNDNPVIVIEIIKANENILWSSTDPEDSTSIFACAITNRQEEVAQYLHKFGASRDRNIIDEDGNNVLHIAAKLAPHSKLSHISGAALQFQSELRWFKSVEAIVPWLYKEQENKTGETPFQVFAREHKNLLKEAEEWMKNTAVSSTVVGALIITITFSAAFTVPGGNDQITGFPIFLNSTGESSTVVPFTVFIISDAISLFTASGSVLMFLGILTSRYAYHDFLISLPLKLIVGLCSLFISIATMAVAFCASLFIMLKGRLGVFIPITVLAGIPIILFMLVQSQLVLEIYSSTCRSHVFGPSFLSIFGKYVKSRLFISRMLIRRPRDA